MTSGDMRFSSRACGKTILTGEHVVVYGYPALLLPLNVYARCVIEIREDADNNSEVRIFSLGEQNEFKWKEICEYISLRRREHFNTKMNLPLLALNAAWKFYRISGYPRLNITLRSSIPIGGFGSSTAIAAAIVKCVGKLAQKTISQQDLWNLLVEIETKNGTTVSGADQCVISYQLPVRFQKNSPIEKINLHSGMLKKFLIIQSGMPSCTTRECVEFVAQRRKMTPTKIDEIFKKLAKEGDRMLSFLKKDNVGDFFKSVKKSGELLISLGIVSSDSLGLIRRLEKLGGYLKLTGAGTVRSGGSGGILCFSNNYSRIESFLLENDYKYLSVKL